MNDTALPPSEILELIRGQARLEAKIDIGAIKTDVAEIKAQRSAAIAYISALNTT